MRQQLRQGRNRRTRKALAATVALVVPASFLAPGLAWARPVTDEAGNRTSATVTLVTGDRVTVSGHQRQVAIKPGPGRKKIGFVQRSDRKHQYVIPSDALGLVSSGAIDERLFDLRKLISFGYDDAHRADLPVLLRDANTRTAKATPPGARMTRSTPEVKMRAATVRKTEATKFWSGVTKKSGNRRTMSAGITKIWLDGKMKPVLAESVPQIGAPTAWKAGFTGKGVTVAVLDSGIDAKHPDFAGKIAATQNFTDDSGMDDKFGHGTHVASTAVGTGAASNKKYRGVAPDAKLAVGKVCVEGGCSESTIVAGMVWAARTAKAKVINLSLGGGDTPMLDPTESTVNELSAQTGALFVISAGNNGVPESIGSPGSADAALTVGSVDKKNQPSRFSSRGPRTGDGALKPEIAAPGGDIVAARAAGNNLGEPVDDSYQRMSGTSMAAPHVAGAAAILAGQHPKWTGEQLKAALTGSAKTLSNVDVFTQGSGVVNVAAAIGQQLMTSPAALSFPVQAWPHQDDKPVARTVTYQNSGTKPVTVTPKVDVRGPGGNPAPAGMFKVSPATVTVPAGGTAALTMTANTKVSAPDGNYTGAIVASTSGTPAATVRTPVAIIREQEKYNVTIKYTNTDGTPAKQSASSLADYTSGDLNLLSDHDQDGSTTVRVPKGRYGLDVTYQETDTMVQVSQPLMTVNRDLTIDASARGAKPVKFTVDKKSARETVLNIASNYKTPMGAMGVGTSTLLGLMGLKSRGIGAASGADYASTSSAEFAEPGADDYGTDSPYTYHLFASALGRMPTGLTQHSRTVDLAAIRDVDPAGGKHTNVQRTCSPTIPNDDRGSGMATIFHAKPGLNQVRYLTPRTAAWQCERELLFGKDDMGNGARVGQAHQRKVFEKGARVERWGTGVVGPSFVDADIGGPRGVTVFPDSLFANVLAYSDRQTGHGGYTTGDGVAKMSLFQNGEKVAEGSGKHLLGYGKTPTAGQYRLDSESTQDIFPNSTRVSASWTFKVKPTTKVTGEPVPLFAVGFVPRLDANNKAPAGKGFSIPIEVTRHSGTSAGRIDAPAVDYSVDDGKTWRKAKLQSVPGNWIVTVDNPPAGFVSLRVNATDSAGTKATHTIIRAYAIKKG